MSCVNPDVHVDVYADEDYNTCKIVTIQVHFDDEVELQWPEVVPGHWGYPKNPN